MNTDENHATLHEKVRYQRPQITEKTKLKIDIQTNSVPGAVVH